MEHCEFIKDQLDALNEERELIRRELQEGELGPRERRALLQELRRINREITVKRREYDLCINPPLPKPDLRAKTFRLNTNHTDRKVSVACVVQNDGEGPATGPFQIVLGVSYMNAEGTNISRQMVFLVPSSVTIEGFGTEYTTEAMENIPLLYRDENANFVYWLEMIVDAENQVQETSDSNNRLSIRHWWVHPALAASPSREVELQLLTPSIPIPPP
ncbi:MAG: hypothetical protein J0H48_00845 [Nitrosospira multiformis]|jgi:hypothetical protein|nr:hypothetical protein [Nitrosospira multiformis]